MSCTCLMHGGLWGKAVVVVFRDGIILCVCKEEGNTQMQAAQELSHGHFPASGLCSSSNVPLVL